MNSTKKFQKKVENFFCLKCGFKVLGDGYTNHCPKCLWSRHVDINPGDRESKCGGMMRPVSVFKKGNEYVLVHECEICQLKKRNGVARKDNFQKVIDISSKKL